MMTENTMVATPKIKKKGQGREIWRRFKRNKVAMFGMCLFISTSISGAKLSGVARELIPMSAVMILVMFILLYCPPLVTGLPALLGFTI